MGKKKHKEKYKSDIPEKTFVAYIIKGNRQIIKREIQASKRFRVEDNTYYIKDHCIFYKNIEGKLEPVSYYRENNPNPYDFKGINKGLSKGELDDYFAEDFHNIMVEIEPDNKNILTFIMSIFNVILNCIYMVILILVVYIL